MTWRVWIDTGGTFTDCVGLGPGGEVRRAKVLSSGIVRRRVLAVRAADVYTIEPEPHLPAGFLNGLRARRQDGDGTEARVGASRVQSDGTVSVEIVGDGTWGPRPGDVLEFSTGHEAPVVGLHLLFSSCFGDPLPAFDLRLGTTRGTNALLEGRGARTAAFLSRGFKDLLHIGDQSRPDIFSLHIDRAPVLADPILAVAARRDVAGEVIEALSDQELERIRAEGMALLEKGVEAVAVSLLHSVEDETDELLVARALADAGFQHISTGSGRSRLRGYLHRSQTAVVDATLTPIMRRYLDEVRAGVGRPFQVMSSAGGLVQVDQFRAKDALLSGPAGGVIGCRHAAAMAGLLPALAFDMGGTSTDVSRVDETLEYDSRHDVGGQIVHAAALAIRTVAAGGGSICRIEHDEAMVGPQSAGADPGPACYGAGGPLTLTDVNLLLGRIDPGRFEVPLSPSAAEAALEDQLERTAGLGRGALLEGFLRVANERMADTIRQVSTRRGFDPRSHTLVAFGGAGGQHACEVAELLDIRRVLVPRDCSLLSAVGIGVAQPELIVHEQVSRAVEDPELNHQLVQGERAARLRLREREGLTSDKTLVSDIVVQMRYVGQDEGIEVDYVRDAELAVAFETAYEDLFGYRVDRPVEVDWARYRVRSVAESAQLAPGDEAEAVDPPADVSPRARVEAWFDGALHPVERVERGCVPVGRERALAGPMLISEPFSSTWVPVGWTAARESAGGGLVLQRLDGSSPDQDSGRG